ncbi:MAG: hypothetical protein R6W84_00375 [Promethearchaeia archaeon]
MRRKKTHLLGILLIFGLCMCTTIMNVRATTYDCPDISVGYTKIYKVTVVDESKLETSLENWSDYIQIAYGENAHQLNARQKSVIMGTESGELIISMEPNWPICNISVDVWNWTTGDPPEVSGNPISEHYILRDPMNLTSYAQQGLNDVTFYSSGYNINGNKGYFLNQLPSNPKDYLEDEELIWEEKWTTSSRKIIHNAVSGDYAFAQLNYLDNCTEIWSYNENGILISYEIEDKNGQTAYRYEIEIDTGDIPGYEIPILLGIMSITLIAVMVFLKKTLKDF